MNKFIKTRQYKQFEEFCRACHREKYIGLCYGPAGAGKTESAYHYTNWKKIEKHIEHNYTAGKPEINFSMKKLHTLFYTPQILSKPAKIIQDLKGMQREFNLLKERALYPEEIPFEIRNHNFVELIIIDEAERLKSMAFELIREFYDETGISFVFIGMPGIEKIIEYYPQLYSRVGFVHQFKNLGKSEIEFIIANQFSRLGLAIEEDNFTDQEAVSAVIRMTNGNFRLINRLLKQAYRIMQVNSMTTLTADIFEAARKCLLIGER